MNNKEYGVKLDIDISKFKEGLEEATELTKEVKGRIEEKLQQVKLSGEVDFDTDKLKDLPEFGEFVNNIEEATQKIEPLSEAYASLLKEYNELTSKGAGDLIYESDAQEAEQLRDKMRDIIAELEKITGEKIIAKGITEPLKEANDETDKLKGKGSGLGNELTKGINKAVSSIKRFTLSLLGIQGVYSILTRAANAYMAQDQNMHTRLQANWIALGAMLAPIIEYLIKLFQKLVAYINVFVKAFTGGKVDLLSKAMKMVEKNTKGTTKAVKSLNKELGTLDEIENLNFDQGGGDIDAGGGFDISDALKEIQDIQLNEEIEKALERLGKKLYKIVYEDLPKLKKWIDENKDTILTIITIAGGLYAALKLAEIYNDISKIIGVSGGTTGLLGMLTVFGMLVDFQLAHKLGDKLGELVDTWFDARDAQEDYADQQIANLNKIKDKINENNKKLEDGNLTAKERKNIEDNTVELVKQAKGIYEDYNKRTIDGKKYTKEQADEIERQARTIERIGKQKYVAEVQFEMKAYARDRLTNNVLNFLFGGLYGLANDENWFGLRVDSSYKGHKFAKGNVAYEPTMGQFGEYAGARSNPEITAPQNMMRETLYEALSEALPLVNSNSGDTILYVNGRELARATYQDYQNEGNRLGSSSIAVRRVS